MNPKHTFCFGRIGSEFFRGFGVGAETLENFVGDRHRSLPFSNYRPNCTNCVTPCWGSSPFSNTESTR